MNRPTALSCRRHRGCDAAGLALLLVCLGAAATVPGASASTPAVTAAVAARAWPAPVQRLAEEGFVIVERFDAPGGMQGFAARFAGTPIALYLTADGRHVLVGSLFDADGHNLSPPALTAALAESPAENAWAALRDANWIGDGSADAERVVYVFTDPNCPYCHRFYDVARPWVEAGKVQLRHVVVGILKPSSPGKAAALLGADAPSAALARHERAYRRGGVAPLSRVPEALRARVVANNRLMQRLGLHNTPAFVFENAAGHVRTMQGLPRGQRLERLLGPR